MYYVEITTGTRVSIYAIRALYPHMSIPEGADLSDLGYAPLLEDPVPVASDGEYLTRGPIVERVGKWYATWVVNPKPVPISVSKYQAVEALSRAGYLTTVDTIMASPETPEETKRAWTHATELFRDSPTVLLLANVLGITSEGLDTIFIEAGSIVA